MGHGAPVRGSVDNRGGHGVRVSFAVLVEVVGEVQPSVANSVLNTTLEGLGVYVKSVEVYGDSYGFKVRHEGIQWGLSPPV